jgi:hypothetical protein
MSQQTFGLGAVPPLTVAPAGIAAGCHDDPPLVDRSTAIPRIRHRYVGSGEAISIVGASARWSAAAGAAAGGGGAVDLAATRSDRASFAAPCRAAVAESIGFAAGSSAMRADS